MFRTDDNLLCPVVASVISVNRVLEIPSAMLDSKICSFLSSDGKITCINLAQALPRLRAIVKIIGGRILGFTKDDIGLHYIWSGGTMTLLLSGTATIISMQIG